MNERCAGVATGSRGRVLIVDDVAANRELLAHMLRMNGYAVEEAADGLQALAAVARDRPDAVVLDVMMPQMDGLEVCRRLKADPENAPIPILLLTALDELEDRLAGVAAGANDFLSKPVNTQELLLRVRNAVELRQLSTRLEATHRSLVSLESLREDMTHMIIHDLRSPLAGLMGYLELVRMRGGGAMDEQTSKYLDTAMGSGALLRGLIDSLLDVSRIEAGGMPLDRRPTSLVELAGEALASLGFLAAAYDARIEPAAAPALADCDPAVIGRVLANLLANAIRFTPEAGHVRVTVTPHGEWVRAAVSDTGSGIPPEYHARIFEKFAQVDDGPSRRAYTTGLGLTFCKLAVEAHGGRIGVQSEVDCGSTFWFDLPAAREELP